jgi:hypothetical protein
LTHKVRLGKKWGHFAHLLASFDCFFGEDMRQNGKDMGQSGKDMGQSYAKGRHNTLALLRRARRRANLNRKSSGNLAHIFANLALVTHVSAQVADLCVK